MNFDVLYTLAMIVLVAGIGLAYSVRVLLKGRAESDRVNRQGGSALLSKSIMEGAYWSLQPVGRFLVAIGVTRTRFPGPRLSSRFSLARASLSATSASARAS